jgi:hypothetical protein
MAFTLEEFIGKSKEPFPFDADQVESFTDEQEKDVEGLSSTSTGEGFSLEEFLGTTKRPRPEEKGRDEISVIDTQEEGYLYKSDLKEGKNASDIRKFMIARFGQDYSTASDKKNDEIVEDFVTHMRYTEANVLSTAGEVRWISKATDDEKMLAQRAYVLNDNLRNVFVNDGYYGAFDGMKDYLFAVASDPSSWVGLLTGGLAKAGALGTSVAGKAVIRKAMSEAVGRTLSKGGSQAAAKKAGKDAEQAILKQLSAKTQVIQRAKRAAKALGKSEEEFVIGTTKLKAEKELTERVAKEGATKALDLSPTEAAKLSIRDRLFGGGTTLGVSKPIVQTGAIDGTMAVLQDVGIQQNRLAVGAQEEFSVVQSAFSSLAGFVGVAAQVGFGKTSGFSGLDVSPGSLELLGNRAIARSKAEALLDDKYQIKAVSHIIDAVESWGVKVEKGDALNIAGKNVDSMTLLLRNIMLGKDGAGETGGLAKIYKDSGLKVSSKVTVSDILTDIIPEMTSQELVRINKVLRKHGVHLGTVAQMKIELGPLLASKISDAGRALNIQSMASKILSGNILKGDELIEGAVAGIKKKEASGKELKRPKYFSYAQNAWKRLLVSAPATTAVNIIGFSQYYVARGLADTLNGGVLYAAGAVRGGAAGKEMQRTGLVYGQMIAQKAKNLMDPYTTREVYEEFLRENNNISKLLKETVSGGVERFTDRFGIPADSSLIKTSEVVVDAASRLAGVSLQDSVTKSQMFIGELDKALRLKHKNPVTGKSITLSDVINGRADPRLIDTDIMGSATDTTLRSVFAKDYTTDDQLLGKLAKGVEDFSSIPGLGTILPFGRFFNNVLATSYQWSAGGLVRGAIALKRTVVADASAPLGVKFQAGTTQEILEPLEAVSRSIVGLTAIGLAMNHDEEAKEQGLPWYQREVNGTIVDFKNVFPMSLWMVVGRAANINKAGDDLPREILQDIGDQLAVGQFARDAQFSNDLLNTLDVVFNEDPDARGKSLNALGKVTGNIASGVTRPLDALNKMAGFMFDTDVAKDVRQEKGVLSTFGVSATKYVDNMIEIFMDRNIDDPGLGSKTLRVGAREGNIQDPNPILRAIGVTTKPGRTSTEVVYSMAEMKDYTASERSSLPAYDRVFNVLFAPIIERESSILLSSGAYKKMNLAERRNAIKGIKSKTAKTVRELVENNYGGSDGSLLALRRKALSVGKDDKRLGLDYLAGLARNPIKGVKIQDMNATELETFMSYIEYVKKNR